MRKFLMLITLLSCVLSCKKVQPVVIEFSNDSLIFTSKGGEMYVEVSPIGTELEAIFDDHKELVDFCRFYDNPGNISECTKIVSEWMTVYKEESNLPYTKLRICVDANETGSQRMCYLYVFAADSGKMLKIIQE